MNGVVHEFRDEGSSPLSRGIHTAERLADSVGGIIPALAGNTPHTCQGRGEGGDHPRSRGEYQQRAMMGANTAGSSPLSRGILGQQLHDPQLLGIIPALAGNTHE